MANMRVTRPLLAAAFAVLILFATAWPATAAELLAPSSYTYGIAPVGYVDPGHSKLTDGVLPQPWRFSPEEAQQHWVGFRQSDASITLSYPDAVIVDQVRVFHEHDQPLSGQIFLPRQVVISFSNDGLTFSNEQSFAVAESDIPNGTTGFLTFNLTGSTSVRTGRYVRIYESWRGTLGNVPCCPDAWLFLGEVEVYGAIAPTQFAKFAAKAQFKLGPDANDDRFAVEALFKLGRNSNGIAPLTEIVIIGVGTDEWTIPAGSFTVGTYGGYVFHGSVGSTQLDVIIQPFPYGFWGFGAVGAQADLTGIGNPVSITLTIGNDAGSAEIIGTFISTE